VNNPPTDRTAEFYDSLVAFQNTHRLPGLQHAQIRGLLAEHLARAFPAGLVAVPPTSTEPVCVCGHPMRQHHEDVCLTNCGCNDGREPEATTDLPARLEAALTARFTQLGNQFAEMRYHEQGPDGWPASHPVGPHLVAEVLRELLPAGSEDTPRADARVRALHQQYRFAGDDTTDYCSHCNQISGGWIPWPCPTVQALDDACRLAAETQPSEPVKLPFVHTDDDGDRLTIVAVMASTYDGEAPVVAVAAEQYHGYETATVYVRPERVEQVVTALRAARQAAEALPAAAHSCGNCEGIDPDTCLTNPDRPAASAGVQTDEETSHG
jgi:hypothetical protein